MRVVDPDQHQTPPAHPPGTVESASTGSGGCIRVNGVTYL